jgi:hypothetical protein
LLLASDNIIVDGAGQLNVQHVVTNYVLGIPTGTTGTDSTRSELTLSRYAGTQ